MGSRAFSEEVPNIPHLVQGKEVGDLRNDVEAAFYRYEKRTGYPTISRVVGGTSVSLAALPVAASLVGTNLLQGQEKASLTLGLTTSELIFTANRPGTPGNSISVELKTGAGEAISVVGPVIEVTLNTGVSTADSVKTLVDGDADAANLVQVASGGAGVAAVAAAQLLAGGVGEGLVVTVNGIAQEIAGAATDTAIPVSIATLTGAANGDAAVLQVESDGVTSDPITLGIVT